MNSTIAPAASIFQHFLLHLLNLRIYGFDDFCSSHLGFHFCHCAQWMPVPPRDTDVQPCQTFGEKCIQICQSERTQLR